MISPGFSFRTSVETRFVMITEARLVEDAEHRLCLLGNGFLLQANPQYGGNFCWKIENDRMPIEQIDLIQKRRTAIQQVLQQLSFIFKGDPQSNELILAICEMIFQWINFQQTLQLIMTNKQHGFVAVTCLTAMTEHGFGSDSGGIRRPLLNSSSSKDVPFCYCKLGLCQMLAAKTLALTYVKAHAEIPVVLDPVLVCRKS